MSKPIVWLLTGNLPERRYLEAIFAERIRDGEIGVRDYLVDSAAISTAKLSLLKNPEQPIAVILNANTTDPSEIQERLGALRRILADCALRGWYATLAVPDLSAWIEADPRLRKAFLQDTQIQAASDDRTRYLLKSTSLRKLVPMPDDGTEPVKILTSDRQPFDVEALKRDVPDFQELWEFIDQAVRRSRRPSATSGAI